MKRNVSILLLILLVGIINAQNNVIGIWGLTEMTVGGEKVKVRSMHVDFNQDGKLYISGIDFGTWEYNDATLNANSEMQLEIINGTNKIVKLTDEYLVLENTDNGTQTFTRSSLPYGKEYKNKLVGEYLLLKIIEKEKTVDIGNSIFDFKNNGTLYIRGMFFAKWRYDDKKKNINIISVENEGFDGDNKIIKTGEELILLTAKGDEIFFKRLDFDKITKNNKASGLIGVWKLDINWGTMITEEAVEEVVEEVSEEVVEEVSEEVVEEVSEEVVEELSEEIFDESDNLQNNIETNYLSLKTMNMYSYGQGNGNSSGMWIFNKKEMKLYIIGGYIPFSGANKIIKISEESFSFIDVKGNKYTAIKTTEKAVKKNE